jgi:hypothetical protein
MISTLFAGDVSLLDKHLLDGRQQTAQYPIHFRSDVVCNARFL